MQRGQSVQLAWSTQNATDVTIDSLGAVALSGTREPCAFGFDDLHADGQRPRRYDPGDRPGDRYGATAATGSGNSHLRIRSCFNGM